MAEKPHTCARCGKWIANPPPDAAERAALYCSFGCEVKGLLSGLGWGVRWLTVSLLWGLTLFGMLALALRALLGAPIANPPAYYGLMVVLALMTAILSVWRKRGG